MAFDLQNMLFEYKSGFSITKIQLSITKMASQFTKWPLGLQVTEQENVKNKMQYILYI